MPSSFVPPRLGLTHYTCPHCCEYAQFDEFDLYYTSASDLQNDGSRAVNYMLLEQHITDAPEHFAGSRCHNCRGVLIWNGDRLYYPERHAPDSAVHVLPSNLQARFQEAYRIIDLSPAAASALLRAILQKLSEAMGWQPNGAETYVTFLFRKVLSPDQHALLMLTCVRGKQGEQKAQPGVIDEGDGSECAFVLSSLIFDLAHTHLPPPVL
jgi:hypothetical protein